MKWTKEHYVAFWEKMKQEGDLKYISFSQRIIKTKYPMLGIRTPILRKQAAKVAKTDVLSYLEVAQEKTYEEVLFKGFLIGKLKDKEQVKLKFLAFVSLIDNWAICDMVISSLKIVAREKTYFLEMIDILLHRKDTFAIRAGYVLLLNYYVEPAFLEEIFARILKVDRDDYFIEMGKAWLISVCFIKEQEKTLTFLKEAPLSFSLFSKTIQKICDSYQISKETKEMLKELKRKQKERYS